MELVEQNEDSNFMLYDNRVGVDFLFNNHFSLSTIHLYKLHAYYPSTSWTLII